MKKGGVFHCPQSGDSLQLSGQQHREVYMYLQISDRSITLQRRWIYMLAKPQAQQYLIALRGIEQWCYSQQVIYNTKLWGLTTLSSQKRHLEHMRCYRVLTVGGKPPAGRASGGNPGSSLTCTSVFSVPSSCMVLVVVSTRFNSRPSGPTYRYVLTVLDVRVILRKRYLSINKLLKIKFERTYWQFSWYSTIQSLHIETLVQSKLCCMTASIT